MENFSASSEIVNVPAGAGYLGVLPTVLLSQAAPSGARVFIRSFSCRAMDIDLSQISFSFRHNGGYAIANALRISAVEFGLSNVTPIEESFAPGVFEIVGYNLSGTNLPFAQPASDALCQARWSGYLDVGPTMPLDFSRNRLRPIFPLIRNFLK